MPFMLLRAFFECLKIIIKTKPDVIVGFGGYATFPICFVGVMLRIPVIIHEQNSIAGLTNKILSKIVTKVLVAYNGVLPSKNTVVTGNPVRDEINNLDIPEIRYKDRSGGLNILVVGGSLGAKKLNEIMPEVCALLSNLDHVVHQVGRGDVNFVSKHYQELGFNAKVHSFIEDMASEYSRADLIICRSGASTVSEIMSAGVATVFVPYPYAVDDHQRYNVGELVKSGASFMVLQEDISTDLLVSMIKSLNREECLKMAKLTRSFAIPDSTDRIVKVIKKYII
jgi:UDP-N-acetylglucosamine--N-acetylmuramyl-(pentapeptide) pyrophosphoryl-undecaprenol N-acetylglucosamine transferase